MGGSSLCPEVMRNTFGRIDGFPDLHVIDSTDPAQVRGMAERLDLARTVFIVSSKSGSTLEPNILFDYFFTRAGHSVSKRELGRRCIAITDPGSSLERQAAARGFRRVCAGVPGIGGRYSALSDFGMVPAAIMGVDVGAFLETADQMRQACGPDAPAADNPGVVLGIHLGVLAREGRDKITIIASPGISSLGAWLEQLLAESTGKNGRGLIPVDQEQLAEPALYGADRVFVYVRLDSAFETAQDRQVQALEQAGRPVLRIAVADPSRLGQEFFRWEMATAIAGSLLGVNPFDQPDVEASKVATRRLTDEFETTGSLSAEAPFFTEGGLAFFADPGNQAALNRSSAERTAAGYLRAHLGRLARGDYFALLAYVAMTDGHQRELQAARHLVRERHQVATCLGYGPRFLHSTGQAYKGGPNTGVFLQITCDEQADLSVPGRRYTFGIVKAAQARGDFSVLAERGRRLLRVHVGPDVAAGLRLLRMAMEAT
jgi:transaldolase / glucose-6-phosphate isomerase